MCITPQYLPLCHHLLPPSIRVSRFSIKRWSRTLLNMITSDHCLVEPSNTNLLSILSIKWTWVQSVQSLSYVWLFVTPWTAALQASLSITNSQSCSNSCPSSQWCHATIASFVISSPPAFNLFQHQGLFQVVSSLHQVAKVLELQLQHQSELISFRIDWFDLLAVQGTLKSLLQLLNPYMTTEKP